jgi:hypothetical protein
MLAERLALRPLNSVELTPRCSGAASRTMHKLYSACRRHKTAQPVYSDRSGIDEHCIRRCTPLASHDTTLAKHSRARAPVSVMHWTASRTGPLDASHALPPSDHASGCPPSTTGRETELAKIAKGAGGRVAQSCRHSVRSIDLDRRCLGRSLRGQNNFYERIRHIHGCFARLRAGADIGNLDRCAGGAGCRRSNPGAELTGASQSHRPASVPPMAQSTEGQDCFMCR